MDETINRSDDEVDAILAARQARRQALGDRYEAMNRRYQESGLPIHVLDTPFWQEPWAAFLAWLKPLQIACYGPAWFEQRERLEPGNGTTWWKVSHICSHALSPEQGHNHTHAAIEEAGWNAVLGCWNARHGSARCTTS